MASLLEIYELVEQLTWPYQISTCFIQRKATW